MLSFSAILLDNCMVDILPGIRMRNGIATREAISTRLIIIYAINASICSNHALSSAFQHASGNISNLRISGAAIT